LPFQESPPPFLDKLLDPGGDVLSKYFIRSIRSYNSMFAFTSLGAKIDTGINRGPGPYVFKINGQVHHRIGSLLPDEGRPPVYAQLYIYDTENEVQNRISIFDRDRECDSDSQVDRSIVEGLVRMFDESNGLVNHLGWLETFWDMGSANLYGLGCCTIGLGSHPNIARQ